MRTDINAVFWIEKNHELKCDVVFFESTNGLSNQISLRLDFRQFRIEDANAPLPALHGFQERGPINLAFQFEDFPDSIT